jgi:hypothetical protein
VEVHAPVASTAAHAAPVAAAHVAPAAAPAQVAPAAAATHAPAAVRSAGPPPSPALAGLEQFLHAIVRARSEPASAR